MYFSLGLLLGDNLGMHELLGFVRSFESTYSCRICEIRNNMSTDATSENLDLISRVKKRVSERLSARLSPRLVFFYAGRSRES